MDLDALLSNAVVCYFAVVGFVTNLLLLTRWLMKEVGRFVLFCRRWRKKYLSKPVNKAA